MAVAEEEPETLAPRLRLRPARGCSCAAWRWGAWVGVAMHAWRRVHFVVRVTRVRSVAQGAS